MGRHIISKLRRRITSFRENTGGDTIVEVLIAGAVLSLVLVAAFTSTSMGARAIRDTQERQQAAAIASSQIEWIVENRGLPGTGNQCFDHTGQPTKNTDSSKDCDFDDDNISGCNLTDRDYCFNILITSRTTTSMGIDFTTYKVTVSWDKFGGGGRNVTNYFYRIPKPGTSTPVPAPGPGPIPSPTGLVMAQIDVGNYHVCAHAQSGRGFCWGKNDFGALGNGTNNNSPTPFGITESGVLSGKRIVSTAAGYNHTCVVDSDGVVYCWGYNSQGQLGNGASGTTNNPNPTAVVTSGPMSGKRVAKINGGDSHTCALTTDQEVYCWGGNNYGQLGNGNTFSQFTPVEISSSGSISGKNLVDITAGYAHTCALADDGTAYCWGFNGHGQLGNGNNSDSSRPVEVAGGLRFRQISAGDEHTCAVTTGGALYCWGFNQQGQVGNNSLFDTNSPVAVSTSGVLGGKTVEKVAAGYRHTCAIASGDAYCWGNNDGGQLGNGEVFVTHTTPVAVINSGAMDGDKLADIATGRYNTCAVATVADGGRLYCWGKNDDGQLGDGKRPVDSSVPSLVNFP